MTDPGDQPMYPSARAHSTVLRMVSRGRCTAADSLLE